MEKAPAPHVGRDRARTESNWSVCVLSEKRGILTVVGAYVDGRLVTGKEQDAVDYFLGELASLSIKAPEEHTSFPG